MVKKTTAVLVIIILLLVAGLINGCETTAGAAKGVASTAEGMGKDTVGIWKAIMKADKWVKDNLW